MLRYEWYKLWHNRKLIGLLLALLIVNSLYFWYQAEYETIPAHAYRKLTDELRNENDDDAMQQLSVMKNEVSLIIYGNPETAENADYPKYCENLFAEQELYALKEAEYKEAVEYGEFVTKAAGAVKEYRIISRVLGENAQTMAEAEKTSREYAALQEIRYQNTQTKGVSEALSLPSLIFFEIFMAILIVSLLLTQEKEQGLLCLYATMKEGRGRMFLTRMATVTICCALINLLFLVTSVGTGIVLYGRPSATFLTEPLQALNGYRQSVLKISIGMFLVLYYVWSCIVSVTVAVLTATASILVSSAMKVYVILFSFVGAEGILYLTIDDRSHLAGWKRINLISFANPGYTIARYRNESLFGRPISYYVVALLIFAVVIVALGLTDWIVYEKGRGIAVNEGSNGHFPKKRKTEKLISGMHTKALIHECTKFLRFEKIGYLFLILCGILAITTKPYQKYYTSMEEMFYQSYLYRLEQAEPDEYQELTVQFYEEIETERKKTSNANVLYLKESALEKIQDYVNYLQTQEGARALDSRGYEKLYKEQKQNGILGICAIIVSVLCGTAIIATEYRTGMAEQIRISPERNKVIGYKILILTGTITAFYVLIYGRYLYQVLVGYGTDGIGYQANSIRDFASYPAGISIAGVITLIYLKRYVGMVLCTITAAFLCSRLKSFLVASIVSIAIIVIPLLLSMTDSGILSYVMFNWFFIV